MNDKRNDKKYCQGYIDCHTSYSNALNQATHKHPKPNKESALKILDAVITEVHAQSMVVADLLKRKSDQDKLWGKLMGHFKAE